jgi:hypothetical protein
MAIAFQLNNFQLSFPNNFFFNLSYFFSGAQHSISFFIIHAQPNNMAPPKITDYVAFLRKLKHDLIDSNLLKCNSNLIYFLLVFICTSMIDMNINSYVYYVAHDLTTITHLMTIWHQTPNTNIFTVEIVCDFTLFHNIHKLISLVFGLCFQYLHHNFNKGFFYNLKEIRPKMKKNSKQYHVSIIT